MKRITQILCLFMLVSHLFAVGEAGAIFLLIAPGAGPAGTGEANVARADDAYASWYNPAGLGFQTGREVAGMHVNWLPNLADDLYYEFLAYKHNIPNLGTFGGHVIFLSLGEQMQTDAEGNELGEFSSNMWALTTNFGTTLSKTSSIGLSFKILQQNLAPTGAGSEDIEGSSTDFAFDVGYLKKYSFGNFGVAITNIGPKIWFMDQSQSDPAPTNMRIGFLSKIYDDGFNKVNLILDANKILVSRYQAMDWNGDGIISGDKENSHDDPWYLSIFTAWLD
ncbi:MAG: PorV/PorQ family protein, partial [Candidatus Marinimicrobia bacterium]|nr:PorV/PorQ family protein [Candidatus Neomarinimicrobiota bacterium]